MDSTILAEFRHILYTTCFTRARDALFDLADALLTDTHARSFVELSQAASFQRAWPSLYEALEAGRIDRPALQRLFARQLPARMVGTRIPQSCCAPPSSGRRRSSSPARRPRRVGETVPPGRTPRMCPGLRPATGDSPRGRPAERIQGHSAPLAVPQELPLAHRAPWQPGGWRCAGLAPPADDLARRCARRPGPARRRGGTVSPTAAPPAWCCPPTYPPEGDPARRRARPRVRVPSPVAPCQPGRCAPRRSAPRTASCAPPGGRRRAGLP